MGRHKVSKSLFLLSASVAAGNLYRYLQRMECRLQAAGVPALKTALQMCRQDGYFSVTMTGTVPVPLSRLPRALPMTAPMAAVLSVTFMA